jgi:uncharacterized protein
MQNVKGLFLHFAFYILHYLPLQKKKLLRWLKILLLLYCGIGIALYYFQEQLMFRPEALPKDHVYGFAQAHREVNLPWDASSNINIIQFTADTPVKGVVLYFHGNRTNISWYARFAPLFTKHGYEVWMMDYPGYGKSTGELTEQMLYNWALAKYKLARVRFSPDSIIIYGKSMGSGIAAQLASVRDCRRLLLETPYYNFPSLISQYAPVYPVQRMIKFKIPTYQYLQKVTAPVTIFHGTDDGVIRFSNASKLKPYLEKQDDFVVIPGGSHNNLTESPAYIQRLDAILGL